MNRPFWRILKWSVALFECTLDIFFPYLHPSLESMCFLHPISIVEAHLQCQAERGNIRNEWVSGLIWLGIKRLEQPLVSGAPRIHLAFPHFHEWANMELSWGVQSEGSPSRFRSNKMVPPNLFWSSLWMFGKKPLKAIGSLHEGRNGLECWFIHRSRFSGSGHAHLKTWDNWRIDPFVWEIARKKSRVELSQDPWGNVRLIDSLFSPTYAKAFKARKCRLQIVRHFWQAFKRNGWSDAHLLAEQVIS